MTGIGKDGLRLSVKEDLALYRRRRLRERFAHERYAPYGVALTEEARQERDPAGLWLLDHIARLPQLQPTDVRSEHASHAAQQQDEGESCQRHVSPGLDEAAESSDTSTGSSQDQE